MKAFSIAFFVLGFTVVSFGQNCGAPPCKSSSATPYRIVYPANTAAAVAPAEPTPRPAAPMAAKAETIAGLPAAIVNYPTEANLPKLANALRQSRVNTEVLEAMVKLGEPAAPWLAEIIADQNAPHIARRQAVQAVGIIGPPAKAAAAPLRDLVEETQDRTGSWGVLHNIARISLASVEDNIPEMIRIVRTEHHHGLLVGILVSIGKRADKSIPELRAMLDDAPGRAREKIEELIDERASSVENRVQLHQQIER